MAFVVSSPIFFPEVFSGVKFLPGMGLSVSSSSASVEYNSCVSAHANWFCYGHSKSLLEVFNGNTQGLLVDVVEGGGLKSGLFLVSWLVFRKKSDLIQICRFDLNGSSSVQYFTIRRSGPKKKNLIRPVRFGFGLVFNQIGSDQFELNQIRIGSDRIQIGSTTKLLFSNYKLLFFSLYNSSYIYFKPFFQSPNPLRFFYSFHF